MKNVAATKGHRVSFAILLVGEAAREGNWVGRDIVLNLLSRPPRATLGSQQQSIWSEFANAGYGYLCAMQEKYARTMDFFFEVYERSFCEVAKIAWVLSKGTVSRKRSQSESLPANRLGAYEPAPT